MLCDVMMEAAVAVRIARLRWSDGMEEGRKDFQCGPNKGQLLIHTTTTNTVERSTERGCVPSRCMYHTFTTPTSKYTNATGSTTERLAERDMETGTQSKFKEQKIGCTHAPGQYEPCLPPRSCKTTTISRDNMVTASR
jgi:hypothetical protein